MSAWLLSSLVRLLPVTVVCFLCVSLLLTVEPVLCKLKYASKSWGDLIKMQLLVQQIWQGREAAYRHISWWYWKSWSSNHTLSSKVVGHASWVWGFLALPPCQVILLQLLFALILDDFENTFKSRHASHSWMEGATIPLYFPLIVLIKCHGG